jgi:hypothetical protein
MPNPNYQYLKIQFKHYTNTLASLAANKFSSTSVMSIIDLGKLETGLVHLDRKREKKKKKKQQTLRNLSA